MNMPMTYHGLANSRLAKTSAARNRFDGSGRAEISGLGAATGFQLGCQEVGQFRTEMPHGVNRIVDTVILRLGPLPVANKPGPNPVWDIAQKIGISPGTVNQHVLNTLPIAATRRSVCPSPMYPSGS